MRHVLLAGLLVFAGLGAAGLAATERTSAENLAFSIGPRHYRIARVSLEGAALKPSDIARLFDANAQISPRERFAPLTAARVLIPEIAGEVAAEGGTQQFVYRDVVFENVSAGRIAKAQAASLEQKIDLPGAAGVVVHYGPIVAHNVDLAQIAHVYGDSSGSESEPLKSIQDDIAIENVTLSAPASGVELLVGRLRAKDVKGRAVNRSLMRWLNDAPAAGSTTAAEQGARLALAAVDVMGGFEIGLLEAQNVSESRSGANPFSLTIKRVAIGNIANSVIGEASLDDLSYSAADSTTVALRHADIRGLELRSLLELSAVRFPRVAHVELEGLDANLPDTSVGGAAREKLRVGSGVLKLGAYRDSVPTQISSRMEHCVIDLSERAGAPADAQLIALGYKEVDLSWALDGEWREKEQEIALRQARLEGRDMGRVEFSAQLENVSPLLFSPIPALARAAAISATAKRLDADFEDVTLIDRTIDAEAKSKGVEPAKLRAEYSTAATTLVSAFFDNDEKAGSLAEAIGKFVANPKQLRLRLQSAKGVSFLTALTSKPSDVLRLVEIEAKTSR